MPTSPALELIWARFDRARKSSNLDGMERALQEFDATYDPEQLPRYAPQKQMARRGAMLRAIEPLRLERDREALGGGSW